jgi:hypothetical protein
MAKYIDIAAYINSEEKLSIVAVAILVAAQTLIDSEESGARERRWARQALYAPQSEAIKAWNYILGKSKEKSVNKIGNYDEDDIQPEVDAVVPQLVKAMSGT